MRLLVAGTSVAVCLVAMTVWGSQAEQPISREDQLRFIENFLAVSGRGAGVMSASTLDSLAELDHPVKCGVSAMMNVKANFDRLDPDLKRVAAQLQTRPVLPFSLPSAGGQFLIHYSKTGGRAAYQPTVDSDLDGHPDYVESVALIADSVYASIIGTLGYPVPPADSFYTAGGDERYDIYIDSMRTGVFGSTYLDSSRLGPGLLQGTSFMVIENDFAQSERYRTRPLDAVRVTVAHEYFHAVQFGMDWSEYDVISPDRRLYWMEMSAVWMEEILYDDINDYYTYLPYFFADPTISLQTAASFGFGRVLHEYASVVFPLYLSEKYGVDIIREIWERCALLGPSGQVLTAIDQELTSRGAGTYQNALREFWLWNFFTGPYTHTGPDSLRFSESEQYPIVSEDVMNTYTLPFSQGFNVARQPQYNGATFVKLQELSSRSTNNFRCDSNRIDTLINSTIIPPDTTIDTVCVDSTEIVTFGIILDTLPQPWGLSLLYQYENPLDSYFIESATIPGATSLVIQIERPDLYRSVTLLFTAGVTNPLLHQPLTFLTMGFGVTTDTTVPIAGMENLPASVLTPYPNPAVLSSMSNAGITFRFQVPTDSLSLPTISSPYVVVDLFTVAGEHIATREGVYVGEDRLGVYRAGIYNTDWDMKNSAGREIGSGVYLAVARLFESSTKRELLSESTARVLVVR